jgi:NhaA family Na+:H+ antiporter
MAVFFLVVGMEIKFEVLRGELSSPRRLALPVLAALGGMVAPALLYLACNLGPGGAAGAWPVTTGTDIAFALAALAIAAPRLPPGLRVFLLTVALADDLGAVGLIAVLFSGKLDLGSLAEAGAVLTLLGLMSTWKRAPFLFYAAGFLIVWGCTLEGGVDTSLAGVACALTVPIGARRPGQQSVLTFFMDSLQPYVAYLILPLFAFTAAGFSLRGVGLRGMLAPLPAGVMLGLLVGKPLGVFGASVLAATFKAARRPAGTTWLELFGVAVLAGAGFTMSLYIGDCAFAAGAGGEQDRMRLAVFVASVLAAAAGVGVLALAQAARAERGDEA